MQIQVRFEGMSRLTTDKIKQVRAAARISINRTLRKAKTEIIRAIRTRWNIAKRDLDRKISLKFCRTSDLEGIVFVRGKPISLMYFRPTMVVRGVRLRAVRSKTKPYMELSVKRLRRVTNQAMVAEILRGKKTVLKRAFFITTKSGVSLVVIRRSTGKLQKVSVITEVSMFKQQKKQIESVVIDAFRREFLRQLSWVSRGKATWLATE